MTLLTSPTGRFVQGDCFDAQTKDQQGNPLTIKTGPNAGQPTQAWIINVAHRKDDPATLPYLMQLRDLAKAAWPAFFTAPNNSPPLFGCSHPKFALKIMDGDGIDDNGKPNAQKPGMAGCWIVKYKTSAGAPKVFNAGQYDAMDQLQDKRAFPRGSKVRVRVNIESNKNDTRPGMYLNPNMVSIEAVATGADIIVSGEDAADAFGASSVAAGGTYAGVSQATTTPPPPPGASGPIMLNGADYNQFKAAGWTDEQMIAAGHMQAPTAAPPPPPPATTTPPPPPYSGYMQTDTGGAPAGWKMSPAANGSYEALKAVGWTDDTLKQHGMMLPL